MQGKGLITTIAIILGLICINELLPSFYANRIEKEAQALSGGNEVKYKKELEKLSKDTLNLGFTKLDYRSAKEKEMKLGLDLKGGINVLLEINQRDLVNDLTNYSTNPVLVEALNRTDAAQKFSTKTYIDNFLFSLML
jgi:SecD/SecF fusion protein